MSLKGTTGAASRSCASASWTTSRYSGGIALMSRNEITCPTFIAAPFMLPSTSTIWAAASTYRRSMASSRASRERATLNARVNAARAACPPINPPILAVRLIRPVGIGSLAMDSAYG